MCGIAAVVSDSRAGADKSEQSFPGDIGENDNHQLLLCASERHHHHRRGQPDQNDHRSPADEILQGLVGVVAHDGFLVYQPDHGDERAVHSGRP